LPREVFSALSLRPGETYLDCTAGLGGHALLAAEHVTSTGRVLLNDVDPSNLAIAADAVRQTGVAVTPLRGNFADIARRMTEQSLQAHALLADLGFSSNQMEDASRGFSFSRDGPLDMRLDPSIPVSAADLVNSMSESELAQAIHEFGEDPGARRIARKLVQVRAQAPILTTARLAEVVRSALASGQRGGTTGKPSTDPSTRTFQALRIVVNDELGCLGAFLKSIEEAATGHVPWLFPSARICILTFHSLEDRMVKRAFQGLAARGLASEVGDQGVGPDEDEVDRNPRARSAKIRTVRLLT
jgi:16S rRNA (cytosine1402-N4)-methyltransferase